MRFRKQILSALLVLTMLLVLLPAAVAQADETASKDAALPGAVEVPRDGVYVLRMNGGYTTEHMETVDGTSCLRVDFYLEGVTSQQKLSSISFKLVYDPAQLTFVKYQRIKKNDNNQTLNGLNDVANPYTPGQFNYALTSTYGTDSISRTPIVTLYFRLADGLASGTQIRFGFSEPIKASYVKPDYTSQVCKTGAQMKPFGIGTVWGDANCDCDVTAADAALVMRALVGQATLSSRGMTNAKVSGGTALCAEDAALILRYVVGLIDRFPAQG